MITGANGQLGSSISKIWPSIRNYDELILIDRSILDLSDKKSVDFFFNSNKPDLVIHTAAKVSGILDRQIHPRKFLTENLQIDLNVIESSIEAEVPNLIYVSSAAIYPENCQQPITEDKLFYGPLEEASLSYGLAKLVGLQNSVMIDKDPRKSYKSLIISNMFGYSDFGEGKKNNLIGSALFKTYTATKSGSSDVEIWGDGQSRREFVFSEDIAFWIANEVSNIDNWPSFMNLGFGKDYSILELYSMAAEVVGFKGSFVFDDKKPNGNRKRLLDSTIAKTFGWKPKISPFEGMQMIFNKSQNRNSE